MRWSEGKKLKERRNPGKWKQKNWTVILLVAADVLLIAGLIITNVIAGNRMSMITNQLNYLIDTNNIVQTDLANLGDNIAATLAEESSLVESYAIDVVDTDFAGGTYDVEISVIPKEYTENTTASIFFGTSEYPLARHGYQYKGSATLSVETVYDGNVTLLFENGSKRNTEVLRYYKGFQSSLRGILAVEADGEPAYHDGTFSFEGVNSYRLEGNEQYAFIKLEIIAVAGEIEIYRQDIIYETQNKQRDERKGFASLFGENEEPSTEGGAQVVEPHESVSGLSAEVQLAIEREVEPGTPVRVYVQAESTEGYTFTYDLFNGTTDPEGDGFIPSSDYFTTNYTVYDAGGGGLTFR